MDTIVAKRIPGASVEIALGCMNFGKRTSEADAQRILARAIERGITFFDTANAYNDGASEKILGKALKGRREQFRVATKVGFGRVGGKPEGLSKKRVLEAIDESLSRLGMDFVDVYYLHVPDHGVPIDESLEAMEELRSKGKIKFFGVSNYAAWQILEMNHICEARGFAKPVISQVMYNLLIRQIETEYLPFTRAYPLHTTVYNPLAGGLLTGRHQRGGETQRGSRFDKNPLYQRRYWSDRFFDLVEEYRKVAETKGMTLVELSYAFAAARSEVDSILVGPGTLEHLDAAIDACQKPLSDEVKAAIDAVHRAFVGTDASYVR